MAGVMIDKETLEELQSEVVAGASVHGGSYASAHELAAVLQEEVEEFWDTVKGDSPDPYELLQVAAVAIRGYEQLKGRGPQPW